jgi:hypothetical protein
MERDIVLPRHQVEAWGLWWIQWQKQMKERLRRHRMSPQSFVNKHLVSSQTEDLRPDTAAANPLTPR